jgi:hypothetical protein
MIKALTSAPGEETEIVTGLDELIKRLDDNFEVVLDELENDRFLIRRRIHPT